MKRMLDFTMNLLIVRFVVHILSLGSLVVLQLIRANSRKAQTAKRAPMEYNKAHSRLTFSYIHDSY